MDEEIKVIAYKPDNLGLIPEPTVERKNTSPWKMSSYFLIPNETCIYALTHLPHKWNTILKSLFLKKLSIWHVIVKSGNSTYQIRVIN